MATAPLFRSLPVANPRTGRIDHHIDPLAATAVTSLAARLRGAQSAWAALTLASRLEVLGAFVTALADNAPAILAALTADTGRATISQVEIDSVMAMVARWTPDAPTLAEQAIAAANATPFGLSAAVLAATTAEAGSISIHLNAGAVSINDAALTAIVGDAEKNSFGLSGLGASRMGPSGFLRFCRRQALLRQTGTPIALAAYAERG